jgi:hypothetical protein
MDTSAYIFRIIFFLALLLSTTATATEPVFLEPVKYSRYKNCSVLHAPFALEINHQVPYKSDDRQTNLYLILTAIYTDFR